MGLGGSIRFGIKFGIWGKTGVPFYMPACRDMQRVTTRCHPWTLPCPEVLPMRPVRAPCPIVTRSHPRTLPYRDRHHPHTPPPPWRFHVPGPTTAPPGLYFFFPRPPQGRCPSRAVTVRSSAPQPCWWKRRAGAKPNPKNTPKKSLTHRETGPKAEPGLLLPAKARLERARRDEHQKIGSNKGRKGRPLEPLAPPVLGVLRAPTKPSQHPMGTSQHPMANPNTLEEPHGGKFGGNIPIPSTWGLLERAPQPQCETPRCPFASSPW